jgi:hypothetical protein
MKRLILILVLVICCFLIGCQRGDLKITPVIAGQLAPHAGYNISPEQWTEPNQPVRMTGVIIWIRGTEPSYLFVADQE